MTNCDLFYSPKPNGNAALKVFCFPFAGGNISTYVSWAKLLDRDVELHCLQLPGRGNRIAEESYSSMEALINDALVEIVPLIDKPYIFVGYSLGAKIAYELMLSLAGIGFPLPVHFVAIASPSPNVLRRTPPIHRLPDNEFIAKLASYNGTPEALLADPDIMQMFLPALRADFTILENYRCSSQTELATKLSIFGGEQDKDVTFDDLLAWKTLFEQTVHQKLFSGGHFFIEESGSLLIAAINDICKHEIKSVQYAI